MSSTNFCRNCGTRLTHKGWRWWLRGALCADCVSRPGVGTYGRTLIGITLVAVAAFALGRYRRPTPPPLIIQRAANSPLSDAPVNLTGTSDAATPVVPAAQPAKDDTVYLCGARTKKGAPCRRRVHLAGERCFQHKGRTAMVPLEKLVINPEPGKK